MHPPSTIWLMLCNMLQKVLCGHKLCLRKSSFLLPHMNSQTFNAPEGIHIRSNTVSALMLQNSMKQFERNVYPFFRHWQCNGGLLKWCQGRQLHNFSKIKYIYKHGTDYEGLEMSILQVVHCFWQTAIFLLLSKSYSLFRNFILPCSLSNVNWHYGGTCHLHLQGLRVSQERNQYEAGSNKKC
jgi:hypothetical protein